MAEASQAPKPAEKPRLLSEVDITKYKVRPYRSVGRRFQELYSSMTGSLRQLETS